MAVDRYGKRVAHKIRDTVEAKHRTPPDTNGGYEKGAGGWSRKKRGRHPSGKKKEKKKLHASFPLVAYDHDTLLQSKPILDQKKEVLSLVQNVGQGRTVPQLVTNIRPKTLELTAQHKQQCLLSQ